MPEKKSNNIIHLIYGCVASILIIALGIALIVSCWQIYQSGDRPYSRDSVGEKLQQIALLIYAVAFIIAGGFVLNLLLPKERSTPAAIRDERVVMKKIALKAGAPTPKQACTLSNEVAFQHCCRFLTGIFFAALMVYPAIYMLNKANFAGLDPTAEIMKASIITLPLALLGLVACHVCGILVNKSILRQTAIYKQIIAEGNKRNGSAPVADKKGFPVAIIRWAVFAVAVAFIVIGIFNGSAQDVLTKAVKICTECIGLG